MAESTGTNSRQAGLTGLKHDFRVVSPYAKLTFNDPVGMGIPVSLIGEYALNTAAEGSNENDAWRAGVELGKKVKERNDWRILGQYSYIQADAFYDGFGDGDFNSGGTNAQGFEILLDYALWKNVILSLDYYNTESISGAQTDDQVIQSDVLFKF